MIYKSKLATLFCMASCARENIAIDTSPKLVATVQQFLSNAVNGGLNMFFSINKHARDLNKDWNEAEPPENRYGAGPSKLFEFEGNLKKT